MVRLERVRWVRLVRRERETAEMLRRLLREVRERSVEASWGGKRVGEGEGVKGQLRRRRVWRVERDLRAAKERERWGEVQLESCRVVRWRKGVEVSQTMEGWEHGSFVVGMLMDCKAFTCLGSRGSQSEMVMVGRRKRRTVRLCFMVQRSPPDNQ